MRATPRGLSRALCIGLLLGSAVVSAGSGTASAHPTKQAAETDPLGFTSVQGGPTHLGFNDSLIGRRVTHAWTYEPGGYLSTPLVVGDRVFVSVGVPAQLPGEDTSELVALSARTGRVLWGPEPLHRAAPPSDLAYLDGLLFTNTYGVVQAWNPVDGAVVWTRDITPEGLDALPGLIAAGHHTVVAVDPFYGILAAIDPASGALRWRVRGDNLTYDSTPSIGAGVVAMAYDCTVQIYSLATGAGRWAIDGSAAHGCPSATAPAPIHAGTVYVQGDPHGRDVSAKTATTVASDVPGTPAYADRGEFWIARGALHARLADVEPTHWSTANRRFYGQPFVAGTTVIAATQRVDTVGGYDALTGRRLWTLHPARASTLFAPGDSGGHETPTLAVGDDMLLVDNNMAITAYQGDEGPPRAPARPAPAAAPFIPTVPPPALGTSWTGVYGDPANDSDNLAENVGAPYTPGWTAHIGRPATQPVITPTGVFVVVANATTPGGLLYGFNTLTGLPLWPPVPVPGDEPGGYLAESDGVLVATDAFHDAIAVSEVTGLTLWSHTDTGPAALPQAAYGWLFEGTQVTNLLTGASTELSTPQGDYSGFDVIADGHLFINGSCNRMYRFTGSHLDWAYVTGCAGGAETSATYAQGQLLAESFFGDMIVHSPRNGAIVGELGSSWLPASAGNTVYATDGSRIVAEHRLTHRINWTYQMPAHLAQSVEITGRTLLAIDQKGHFAALDALTGAPEWSATIPDYGEPTSFVQGTRSMAAAQGVVAIPTNTGLVVLRGTPDTGS